MKRKILVLEDEENIRSFLVLNLKRSGYEVIEAETGEIALEKYHENQDIAVAVLDVMLPGIDGYEVCRAMRGAGYQAGVIMLTARTQEADKVTGLMNGADDYVTKPFSVIELAARVDALYRRVSGSPFSEDDVIKSGPFKLNLRAREVLKNGVKIELTQIEYGLLKAFMQNIGKALSRDELLEMVWGHHYVGELKIVDVNIRRLRIKIEDSPADPTHIVTVRGYGYMWEADIANRRTRGGGNGGGFAAEIKRVDTCGFYPLGTPVSLCFMVWRRPETGDRSEIGERQRIFSTVGEHGVLPCPNQCAVSDSVLLHRRFYLRRRDTR
ncbi:DNA-binding response regulator [Butyricicoccus sp. AF10-3]|nr:DNA-binding response regulator [Butyricicoccus sp. AF10-3]